MDTQEVPPMENTPVEGREESRLWSGWCQSGLTERVGAEPESSEARRPHRDENRFMRELVEVLLSPTPGSKFQITPSVIWSIVVQGILIHCQVQKRIDEPSYVRVTDYMIKWASTFPLSRSILSKFLVKAALLAHAEEEEELLTTRKHDTAVVAIYDLLQARHPTLAKCLLFQGLGAVVSRSTDNLASQTPILALPPQSHAEVDVDGTPEEWTEIYEYCQQQLPKLGLNAWFAKLVVPLKSFIQLAQCRLQKDEVTRRMVMPYMRSICTLEAWPIYERNLLIHGWCSDLFPYLVRGDNWVENTNLTNVEPVPVLLSEFPTTTTFFELRAGRLCCSIESGLLDTVVTPTPTPSTCVVLLADIRMRFGEPPQQTSSSPREAQDASSDHHPALIPAEERERGGPNDWNVYPHRPQPAPAAARETPEDARVFASLIPSEEEEKKLQKQRELAAQQELMRKKIQANPHMAFAYSAQPLETAHGEEEGIQDIPDVPSCIKLFSTVKFTSPTSEEDRVRFLTLLRSKLRHDSSYTPSSPRAARCDRLATPLSDDMFILTNRSPRSDVEVFLNCPPRAS